jgi:hypothetical protein
MLVPNHATRRRVRSCPSVELRRFRPFRISTRSLEATVCGWRFGFLPFRRLFS